MKKQQENQTNILNVGGDAKGPIQVGGSNNTQNVSYSSNDAIGEVLVKVIEAVRTSQLNSLDKDDVMHSLQQLQKLSQQEKTPDVIKRAKEKLDVVQSAIKVGTDLGNIVLPYLPMIAGYFNS
jgi:hypothetical protein